MSETCKTLNEFDIILRQAAPSIANRLQPGLAIAEIEAKVAPFNWILPEDAFTLYHWYNGLSGTAGRLNLAEKLLRLKGKWHGELAGRENEIHLWFAGRLIIIKFLPLEYALAGHRHLKLGRYLLDLLPIAILTEGKTTLYCMMRLDPEAPIIYCANGTNLPPMKVTESFLSTQPQFSRLSQLVAFLIEVFQRGIQSIAANQAQSIDCELSPMHLAQLYQPYIC